VLKQLTITLDTSDPLQAQLLVEYFAAEDRGRFGRCCLLLGYLAATGQMPAGRGNGRSAGNSPSVPPSSEQEPQPRRGAVLGGGLFGLE
jgi:hypothetical protein